MRTLTIRILSEGAALEAMQHSLDKNNDFLIANIDKLN